MPRLKRTTREETLEARRLLAERAASGELRLPEAVTAIRLLAHHGQLRRVLLVCPKPLVTNWQREFAKTSTEIREAMTTAATAEAPATEAAPAVAAKPRYDRSIVEGALRPAVWKIAWPTMLTNAIGGLQGMVDHVLVGRLEALAR